MPTTAHLTKSTVDGLKPEPKRRVVWDTKVTGFGVRIMPSGAKSFVYVYRFDGQLRWFTIGPLGKFTADTARAEAQRLQVDVGNKVDPVARKRAQRKAADAARRAPRKSLHAVAAEFVERHAKPNNRSWRETKRILDRYVVPAWGKRQIGEISRSDVNELLDAVADKSGKPMANAVLAQVRKLFNWCATRDDAFSSPIVPGMTRINPAKMKRDRILSDDEIRLMWAALERTPAPYRQLVRFLLLTAQRRDEAAQIRHADLAPGLWEIPAERFKTGRAQSVPLSPFATEQLEDLGDIRRLGDYAFTTNGRTPFSGFSKAKARLDAEMARLLRERNDTAHKARRPQLAPWRIHDLRRTAKTLMQRAGVRPDISERVLGHVIAGVEGTYDKHSYLNEKRDALCTLATQVKFILADIPQELRRIAGEISVAVADQLERKIVPLKVVGA